MFRKLLPLALTLALFGCPEAMPTEEDPPPDNDGDGLPNAFERQIGTNPNVADSDGDGFSDGMEWNRYFFPMNENDFPYQGQYPRQPLPTGRIQSTGWAEGDVSHDWDGVDQFGETLKLHRFYGNVIVVELSADW